ncbi:MAG: GNAT family N-acetyltransferase [Clostridia bacterium]|jgi:ribosomal protein S18 acetylase RimI-like enzyme|nr:GNAT family N-acetyltransferase [Clostridia bacterium]MCI2014829.1 GNAT family N-acetyltransferase [Clostridia bacterium]
MKNQNEKKIHITYKTSKVFLPKQLEELFLSVDWASGHYPEKLSEAIKNSDTVFTAWDGETMVGLANVLDDKVMTAYVHFLLVRPNYQSYGIGKELIRLIKEKYKDFLRIVLISYDDKIKFYQNCGFETGKDETPMFITSLWN